MGGTANKLEYFMGVSAKAAVEFGETLRFDPIDIGARESESAARLEVLKRMTGLKKDLPTDPYGDIDLMFGRSPHNPDSTHRYPEVSRSTVPLSTVRKLAEVRGVPVSEVANMDMIDLIEFTIAAKVRGAAAELRLWALENGRSDLTDKMIIEVSQ
jgi:hypothetical protein